MLKDLLKEGGLYTLANFLTKGISLLLIPFYTAYFTPSDYGVIGMLSVFGGFMGAIASFQIYQALGRYIAEDIPLIKKQKITSTALLFNLFSFLIFFCLSYIYKSDLISMLSSDYIIPQDVFVVSIIAIIINNIIYTFGTQLKFLRNVKAYTITTFLHSILNIIFILLFALKLDYGVKSIYYAAIIVAPIIIIIQLIYLKKYFIFYFGKHELLNLLKFSIPLIPAAIAYLVLNLTDRFFIKEISMSANGIYEVAFKFSSIFSILIVAFQSALAPIIYQNHHLNSTKLELVKIFNLFFALGSLLVLILSLFSYETLYLFTNPSYYDAKKLMPLFYLSIFITGLGLFSPGIHVMKKTKIIPLVVIVTALINIFLNYILIHKLGLIGAAIATLISIFINNISLFIFSQKLYYTPYHIKKISIIFFILCITLLVGYLIDDNISELNLFFIKISIVIIYIFIILKVKLINYRDILNRLYKKK